METSMANVTDKLPMTGSSSGIFLSENPLHLALPLLCLQMFVVVTFTRALAILLTPLRQPRIIAEIIGGILLGCIKVLGCSKVFLSTLFPNESLRTLDLLSNFGYLLFLFRVGLELDLTFLCRSGKRSLAIAVAGISAPFILCIRTSQVLSKSITPKALEPHFLIFMGVNLSVTSFPILARILNELELLNTDLGHMSLCVAAVHDIIAWILILLLSPPGDTGSGSVIISVWVLLNHILFITVVAVILRLAINWMSLPFQGGERVREAYICTMLAVVPIASFIADSIGIHSFFGAFVVGIMVPKEGPFASVLINKVDYYFISSLFLPLYFVSTGLKTNIASITSGGISWAYISIMIFNTCLGKIGGTIIASIALKVPFREAVVLGFLVNTKGIVEQIVQYKGKDDHKAVLDHDEEEAFSIMVLIIVLLIMLITMGIVMHVYKPGVRKKTMTYKLQHHETEISKLRVLACYNDNCSRPTIMTLMESLRGNGCCELTVHALALMVFPFDSFAQKNHPEGIIPLWKTKLGNDIPVNDIVYQIVCEFRAYQQFSKTLLHGLHDSFYWDVVARAKQTGVGLIILPLHKPRPIDGDMWSIGYKLKQMYWRVLHDPPCSVAILIDRGLGFSEHNISYSVVALFFGGSDDREALAYGLHLAGYPGIDLTIISFILPPSRPIKKAIAAGIHMDAKQDSKHNERIRRYLERVATDTNVSVKFEERVLKGNEVIVSTIKEMVKCRLFLVGHSSPVMPPYNKTVYWELGSVGSYLATPYLTAASAMVFWHEDSIRQR